MRTSARLTPGRLTLTAVPALLLALALQARGQISLSTAVDLAQKSSPQVRVAQAQIQRATAALSQARDAYIPNLVIGANPGYVYGYPLGYPSLFQANSQSIVFSFSQPDYIRSARAALKSAQLNLQDASQQIALDVSTDYIQLDHDLQEIAALDQESTWAAQLVSLEQDRVQAGVDPRISALQAQLTAAQVDEKRIHLRNDADEMRQKLAHLTGLPAAGLTTLTASIPPEPNFSPDVAAPIANNPGIAAAYANAKSKLYLSFGDARQNFRPLIGFGGQYSFFEKFANYQQYFPQGLQYNNAAVGVTVTFPLFDATRRSQGRLSAADARAAEASADQSRDQLSEQDLTMRRTIQELRAQQRVARLQSEISEEQLKAIDSQMTNGSGSPGAQPVSPIEAQKAHIQERERYEDMLDADFSLIKVELSLLRTTGQIDNWVHSALNAAP